MIEFPDHLIGLAENIMNGFPVEDMIHDALIDLDMPHCAKHFENDCPRGYGDHAPGAYDTCFIARAIIEGRFPVEWGNVDIRMDFFRYVEKLKRSI